MLSASGDGLRAHGALTVRGGALSIACGESGLRAGGELDVLGGVLWVDESETGLTGAEVSVENAEASIVSAGEGVRADSGRGGSVRVLEGAKLAIASGGDGITAGADVELRGGEISVWCSGRSGAPLDAGGAVYTDGGTLIAAGRGDGRQVDEDSAQCALRRASTARCARARAGGGKRERRGGVLLRRGRGLFPPARDLPGDPPGRNLYAVCRRRGAGRSHGGRRGDVFPRAFTDGDDEDDERGGDDAQGGNRPGKAARSASDGPKRSRPAPRQASIREAGRFLRPGKAARPKGKDAPAPFPGRGRPFASRRLPQRSRSWRRRASLSSF